MGLITSVSRGFRPVWDGYAQFSLKLPKTTNRSIDSLWGYTQNMHVSSRNSAFYVDFEILSVD